MLTNTCPNQRGCVGSTGPHGRLIVRTGVTLVELLIVIGIMVAVMAVAIPVVRLTTNDNRVSMATQTVRSFLMEAAAAAERNGKAYVYLERNINAPNFCYRLYRGRPRPQYRGESETAYAIKAPNETVILPGVPGGSPPVMPGAMAFDVFYLFNADASRVRPYEYMTFRDRPEKYLVYQSFQMPAGVSMQGPVAKVYCRLDPQTPMSSASAQRSGMVPMGAGAEFETIGAAHNGWPAAATTVPQRAGGGGPAQFWPADRVFYPATGPANPADIPNFAGGSPGQFVSRLLAFEVSQSPMLDELNYLDLPQGMAIYLGGSGFGEEDTFFFDGVPFQNSLPHIQFAFNENLGALSDATISAAVTNELQDPTFSFVKNENSPIRAEYYPRIEFEAGGRITRAFVMSPRYTAAGSVMVANSNKIARLGPIYPLSPLFLLIGEDNVQQRMALPVTAPVMANDFWIMLGAQTSTPKVVKAQVGVNLDVAHIAVAGSISER
ncbi:MAG: type II secretion system protein [Pirellulaceae bacterium]|nr:type II secretion system protein [Pirellulaceae bacterium]